MIPTIPLSEIEFIFSRSSGPGGQNVNKTSTKVMAVWNVAASPSLSDEQKKAIIKYYQSETIRVTNQETRSQPENKLRVINKLNGMVERALIVEKERVPTKASLASRLKRIFLKKQRSEAKRNRQKPNQEE